MKTCNKCKESKEYSNFGINKKSKDGYSYWCKTCICDNTKRYIKNNSELCKEKKKLYRQNNKETISLINSNYRENNKDKAKIYAKKYYCDNKEKSNQKSKEYRINNPEKIKELNKNYYLNNKEKSKEHRKNYTRVHNKIRKEQDPLYKLSCNIRTAFYDSFKVKGFKKKTKTLSILGLDSFQEFKDYLESKFEPWMNWDNKGLCDFKTANFGWDVDHVIPLSTAITEEDIIRLNHYTNLQPLCSYINRVIKKDKYENRTFN